MADYVIEHAAAEVELETRPGETVLVVLEENAGTGFRWAVAVAEGPVETVGSEYSPSAPGRPGAGGGREICLRTTRSGAAHVRLELARSWSGEIADTMQITLRVS
ncbi:hypothetical protein E1258_14220 [Micromonospora sp. KC207]|uniref:protease inhibitor I42 family protein n=1 Tax=Micromonospora sp. KC207 TaxID=2530377 RepID=UPI00104AC6A6|nr:protease inhibitor I42 family protein [Micromonospora sp. KC207]TDC60605.1 hypothetical protein E1258_14220 [Micromonospora sp. KC207]